MSDVTIHQITSRMMGVGIKAYMNVDEGDLHVRVWTNCFECPTYLVQKGALVELIQFDSEEVAEEWLGERWNNYSFIMQIEDDENNTRDTSSTASE